MALAGGAAVAWPLTPLAQRAAKIPRIGILNDALIWDHFRRGLHAHGYVEGRNMVLVTRAGEDSLESLAAAAAALAALPVDVIATWGTPASLAAKRATRTIPIVAIGVGDPVRVGLVASLARPGGNITGNTIQASDAVPKRLQLLKELIPQAQRVGFLWNPDNDSNTAQLEELKLALPRLGMSLISVEARGVTELDAALTRMMQERPDVFQMTSDPALRTRMGRIIAFMDENKLPAMYQTREAVTAGGLISYGPDLSDLFLHAAGYVHRILQGTQPADLPVETPTTFELVINLKTASTLGISVPLTLLARANEVVE
jgi:putative ABC transport system substrate-binding protein